MINLVDLTGKRIVVTGASQGIGQGTAVLLSKLGAKVILIARNEANLQQTYNMLDGIGHSYYVLDLQQVNEIEATFKKIIHDNGPLDGLVYCAGISNNRPLNLFKPSNVFNVLNVNLCAFIECVRCISKKNAFNPGMRIVGISSVAAFRGDKTQSVYSASKAGMNGAVRSLAKELAEKQICINTVAPAFIGTAMCDGYLKRNGETSLETVLKPQYLGLGKIEDVANAVAFLMCPAAGFITGICLPVDGGATTN